MNMYISVDIYATPQVCRFHHTDFVFRNGSYLEYIENRSNIAHEGGKYYVQ